MQGGEGNLTPSAITLVLGSDYDITTSSSWEEKRVSLNVVETNIGSCFSLNNNSVLVGDNVNAKYLEDENGQKFSPIVSPEAVIFEDGSNLTKYVGMDVL